MVLTEEHFGEIRDPHPIDEPLISGSQDLNAILTRREPMNASKQLGLKQGLAELLIHMEEDDLSVTSSNADFISSDCLNALDTLSADILGKDKQLVFNLEAAEVSRLSTSKEKLLVILGEDQTTVISDERPSVDQV